MGAPQIYQPSSLDRVASITSSATPTINTNVTRVFLVTALATNITDLTTNLSGDPIDGQRLLLRFKDDGTPRTISHGSGFMSGAATMLTTTVAGKTHVEGFLYDSTVGKFVCAAADPIGY